jgi:DNA-cytosine methyltransferase
LALPFVIYSAFELLNGNIANPNRHFSPSAHPMNQETVPSPSSVELASAGRLFITPLGSSPWSQILLLEDNAARAQRRKTAGLRRRFSADVVVRFHSIGANGVSIVAERTYSPGTLGDLFESGGRTTLALNLLDSMKFFPKETLVVAGARYGGNQLFTGELSRRGLSWVVELPRSAVVTTEARLRPVAVTELLASATWKNHDTTSPTTGNIVAYSLAHLGHVLMADGARARLFAAQTGAIDGIHQGTIIGLSSATNTRLHSLLHAVGWARWIRPLVRSDEKRLLKAPQEPRAPKKKGTVEIAARSNIKLARQHDESASSNGKRVRAETDHRKRVLLKESTTLNVVELFAGAGGMGLGFLLTEGEAGRYRLGFSGEVHPVYAATLGSNHALLAKARKGQQAVPDQARPIDLRSAKSLAAIGECMRPLGDTHVLIGGPPCQGFSNANRNSWHAANPHNELIDVFLKYVRRLKPRVFLMENVQGIIWTQKQGKSDSQPTVVHSIAQRMERAGYLVFPKLLDAVWYGVPQYRSRFFLLGIHRDLGYRREDFGSWGPFPLPTHGPGTPNAYTTVRNALRDLPRIGNGNDIGEMMYAEPLAPDLTQNPYLRILRKHAQRNVISDHVTSRHAEYVLDRYRQIPPGGNWEDITDHLTNYADVQRTHSNIYRRLSWHEPSITIGHYRKSMLVHPSQNRGLSLREAARLQSFPDWFRFLGTANGTPGGLMHKQQQLANAVCPLVTKSIAEFLLEL